MANLNIPSKRTGDSLSSEELNKIVEEINKKVDSESNKSLSSADYTSAEKNKLAGIDAGATANSNDAQLKSRSNHTGQQPISSVTGLQGELDNRVTAQQGRVLSSNDYTLAEKNKLAGIDAGATANGITRSLLNTTEGQSFSGSFPSIVSDGAEVVRKFIQERVLIIGSSNAAGAGASTYQNSWVAKFETLLNAKGIATRNVSIGGTNTQSSLDRFFKDVLTWNPTVVIEATALWNEGLYAGNFDAVNTALKNFGKLNNLCQQFGIRLLKGPVLPYTGSGGNLSTDKVQSFNVFYANMIDSHSIGDGMSLAEGNHIFPAINSGDNIHVNDVGHQLVFDCLNPYIITHPHLNNRNFSLSELGVKVSENPNNTGDYKGLKVIFPPEIRLKSFSVAFQVKWSPATQPVTLMGLMMDNPTRLRIRHNVNYLSLTGNGEGVGADVNTPINTASPENIDKWCDIVVTFSSLRNKGTFFFNGVKLGEIDCPTREILGINFLGNGLDAIYQAINHAIKNIFIYRTCLDDNTAKNFFKGIRPKRSLILASPMNEVVTQGGIFTNYACSPLAIQNSFIETTLV